VKVNVLEVKYDALWVLIEQLCVIHVFQWGGYRCL